MPKFGRLSRARLDTCDQRLQDICAEVIKMYDFTILCGHRSREEQDLLFKSNKSKLVYPNSNHNNTPSTAVDIAPWPLNWNNRARFYLLAGMMFTVAKEKGYKLRWGGDWDGDWEHTDQTFHDLPHFEILD